MNENKLEPAGVVNPKRGAGLSSRVDTVIFCWIIEPHILYCG